MLTPSNNARCVPTAGIHLYAAGEAHQLRVSLAAVLSWEKIAERSRCAVVRAVCSGRYFAWSHKLFFSCAGPSGTLVTTREKTQ